jgi:cysteine rich repeat protein
MKEMNDACQGDVQKFCKNISLGSGRLMRCLKRHEAELSSACQDEFAQAWSMRRSNR